MPAANRITAARPGFARRLRRRCRRGAAGLIAVLFVSFIAITVAAAVTVYGEYKLGWDRWRMAGQVWAEWVQALDRAAIPATWTGGDWTSVRDGLYGGLTTELPAAGLGGDAGRDFGVSVAEVPMRFTVVEVPPAPDLPVSYCASPGLIGAPPEEQCQRVGTVRLRPASPGRLDAVRRGAIDGGLGNIAIAGPGGALQGSEAITDHEAVLAAGFRDAFVYGDLVAITHVSIVRRDRALHRRAPAGRPDLAGMQTDLDMGGRNMTVAGAPPSGVAPADSLDVEADRLEQIGQAVVRFEAPPTSDPEDLEPAVQADFVVVGSLSLVSPNLEWAHEIGVRGGVRIDTDDEALRVTGGTFASAETKCDRVDADEHCATTADLVAGNLDMVQHPYGTIGIITVHREEGTNAPDGSGVRARTMHANRLELSGECHGCTGFGP